MKRTSTIASLIGTLGLAVAARAQIFTTPGISASLDLTWREDPGFAHNDNGYLEPGERALVLMSLSFTGQSAAAAFYPLIGEYSSGTVVGFGGAYLDITNTAADATGLYNGGMTVPLSASTGPNVNSAGTTGYGVRQGWRIQGNQANGTLVANGFTNVGPGQFLTTPASANVTNPIVNLHRLGWAPASYARRTAAFSIAPAADAGYRAVALYMNLDGATTGGVAFIPLAQVHFGSVEIPVWPEVFCDANCDASTTPPILNVLDFTCFLNRFAAGSSFANCDASTTPPVLNVLDFSCFLNRYAVGCP